MLASPAMISGTIVQAGKTFARTTLLPSSVRPRNAVMDPTPMPIQAGFVTSVDALVVSPQGTVQRSAATPTISGHQPGEGQEVSQGPKPWPFAAWSPGPEADQADDA